MKKQICMAAAFIAVIGVSNQLMAQTATTEIAKTRTKSNNANEKTSSSGVCVVKISSSVTGCDIVIDNAVVAPRDAGSGLATGKRMHKPYCYAVSVADNSVAEVTAPRDMATGMASGKSAAKVSMSDFHFVIKNGAKTIAATVEDGVCTLPADCPDGEYDMTASWSWGATNSGGAKRCVVSFSASMENGFCTGTHIKDAKLK